jgi:hypothetical protein
MLPVMVTVVLVARRPLIPRPGTALPATIQFTIIVRIVSFRPGGKPFEIEDPPLKIASRGFEPAARGARERTTLASPTTANSRRILQLEDFS